MRRSVPYLASTLGSMVLPFVTLPIMTRWLSPADYGIVAIGQVVASLFMGLASLGVTAGLERNFFQYEKNPRELGRLMHSGLVLVLVMTLGLGALMWAAAAPLAAWLLGDGMWGPLLWVMAITSALGVMITVQLVYLRNRGYATQYMIVSLGALVLEAALTIAGVAVADLGVWGLVAGPLLAKLVVTTILWTRMTLELPPAFEVKKVKELLGIGLPLLPRTCFGVADNGVDRLLVNWLQSLGQVGLFGIANRIGYSVFSLMTAIEQLYVPEVYRLMFEGGRDGGVRIGRLLSPYFYVSIVLPSLVVLFTEEMLWVLVTPAFYGVTTAAAVLAAYYGQMFFGKIVGVQFVYAKKTWYTTPFAVLRLVTHLVAALLLIPSFGATGAALALLATGLLVDGFAVAVAQRAYRIEYELRVVIPGLALLYGATAWIVGTVAMDVSYPARLAGKVAIVAALLLFGWRWMAPMSARVIGVLRARGTMVRV
jgi:O-antigen/teichoic acid export membrane protein